MRIRTNWVRDLIESKSMLLVKIPGSLNRGDPLTKWISNRAKHFEAWSMAGMYLEYRQRVASITAGRWANLDDATGLQRVLGRRLGFGTVALGLFVASLLYTFLAPRLLR